MADLGIHKADLIHYLLDDVIESAMAVTETLDKRNPDRTPINVDDNAVCIFRTQKGVIGTMEVSWICYGCKHQKPILTSLGIKQSIHDPLHTKRRRTGPLPLSGVLHSKLYFSKSPSI